MRCPSGLIVTALLMTAFSAGAAWAQGETQTTVAPPAPSPSLESMPHWSEFPVVPTDVPTAADIKQRVDMQTAARDQLRTEFSALQWDKFEPDALVAAM
ncbi:MAG TPA: hypothetical protein VG839_06075, partial [Asticcacaulis sp.]|nr:hypothetical protein [Asticcacaulis sp.]